MSKRKNYSSSPPLNNKTISISSIKKEIKLKMKYEESPYSPIRNERALTANVLNLKHEYNDSSEYSSQEYPEDDQNLVSNFARQSSNSTYLMKNSDFKEDLDKDFNQNENNQQIQICAQHIPSKLKVEYSSPIYYYIYRINMKLQSKFYLFADQVIDINYMRSLADNRQEDYLKAEQNVCLFHNMKHINSITHRIDNKFIEIQNELVDKYLDTITPIVNQIKSLGEQTLFSFAENIEKFWNHLSQYRQQIKDQGRSTLYQQHAIQRQEQSDQNFNQIVQKLHPNRMLYYCYYKVNYEKQQFDSCQVGYSPALQELLAGNSYAFKEHILQKGFVDPISQQYRYTKCFRNADAFLQLICNKKQIEELLPESQSQLFTLDQYQFPVLQKITRYNLDLKYDQENNLNFSIFNVLAVYEFELFDEKIPDQLQAVRVDTKYNQIVNFEEKNFQNVKKQVEMNQFIQKYYKDDILDLLTKGNKWNKRCGVVDIPKKKIKQSQEKIEDQSSYQ